MEICNSHPQIKAIGLIEKHSARAIQNTLIPSVGIFGSCCSLINGIFNHHVTTERVDDISIAVFNKKEREKIFICFKFLRNVGHLCPTNLIQTIDIKPFCFCQYPEISSAACSLISDPEYFNYIDQEDVQEGENYVDYLKRVSKQNFKQKSLRSAQLKYMTHSKENVEEFIAVLNACSNKNNIESFEEMMKNKEYRDDALQIISGSFDNELILQMLLNVTCYYLEAMTTNGIKEEFDKETIFFIHNCLTHLIQQNPRNFERISSFLFDCDDINIQLKLDIIEIAFMTSSHRDIIEQTKKIASFSNQYRHLIEVKIVAKLLKMKEIKLKDTNYIMNTLKKSLYDPLFCHYFILELLAFKHIQGMNQTFAKRFDEIVVLVNDVLNTTETNEVVGCLYLFFDCVVQYTGLVDSEQVLPIFQKITKYMSNHRCVLFYKLTRLSIFSERSFVCPLTQFLSGIVDSMKPNQKIKLTKVHCRIKPATYFIEEGDCETIDLEEKKEAFEWGLIVEILKKQKLKRSDLNPIIKKIFLMNIPLRIIQSIVSAFNSNFSREILSIAIEVANEEMNETTSFTLESVKRKMFLLDLLYGNAPKQNSQEYFEQNKIISVVDSIINFIAAIVKGNPTLFDELNNPTKFNDEEITFEQIKLINKLLLDTIGGFNEDYFISMFQTNVEIKNLIFYLYYFVFQTERSNRDQSGRHLFMSHNKQKYYSIIITLIGEIKGLKEEIERKIYDCIVKKIIEMPNNSETNKIRKALLNNLHKCPSSLSFIHDCFNKGIIMDFEQMNMFLEQPLIQKSANEVREIIMKEINKNEESDCIIKLYMKGFMGEKVDLKNSNTNEEGFMEKAIQTIVWLIENEVELVGIEEFIFNNLKRISFKDICSLSKLIHICDKEEMKERIIEYPKDLLSLKEACCVCLIGDETNTPIQIQNIGEIDVTDEEVDEITEILISNKNIVEMLTRNLMKKMEECNGNEELSIVRIINNIIIPRHSFIFECFKNQLLNVMLKHSMTENDKNILKRCIDIGLINGTTEEEKIVRMLTKVKSPEIMTDEDVEMMGIYKNLTNLRIFEQSVVVQKPTNNNPSVNKQIVFNLFRGDKKEFKQTLKLSFEEMSKRPLKKIGTGEFDNTKVKMKQECLDKLNKMISEIKKELGEEEKIDETKEEIKEETNKEEDGNVVLLREIGQAIVMDDGMKELTDQFIDNYLKGDGELMKRVIEMLGVYSELKKEQKDEEKSEGCKSIIEIMESFNGVEGITTKMEEENGDDGDNEDVPTIEIPHIGLVPVPPGYDYDILMQLPEQYRVESVMEYYQTHPIPKRRRSEQSGRIVLSRNTRLLPIVEEESVVKHRSKPSKRYENLNCGIPERIETNISIDKMIEIYLRNEEVRTILEEKFSTLICINTPRQDVFVLNLLNYLNNEVFEYVSKENDEKIIKGYWAFIKFVVGKMRTDNSDITQGIVQNAFKMVVNNVNEHILLDALNHPLIRFNEHSVLTGNNPKELVKCLALIGKCEINFKLNIGKRNLNTETITLIKNCMYSSIKEMANGCLNKHELTDLLYCLMEFVIITQGNITLKQNDYIVIDPQNGALANSSLEYLIAVDSQLRASRNAPLAYYSPNFGLLEAFAQRRGMDRSMPIEQVEENGDNQEEENEEENLEENQEGNEEEENLEENEEEREEENLEENEGNKSNKIEKEFLKMKLNQLEQIKTKLSMEGDSGVEEIFLELNEEEKENNKNCENCKDEIKEENKEGIDILDVCQKIKTIIEKNNQNELIARIVFLILASYVDERKEINEEILTEIVEKLEWFIKKELALNKNALNESLVFLNEFKEFLPFETKYEQLLKSIEQWKDCNHYKKIEVNRNEVFITVFNTVKKWKKWNALFKISFMNEQGNDNGGLLKECYTLLIKELIGGVERLFITQNNTIIPNWSNENKEQFIFVGKCLAKMIADGFTSDFHLAPSVLRQLLNRTTKMKDLKKIDFEMNKHIENMLTGTVNGWGLTFTVTENIDGYFYDINLKENGSEIDVNDDNKKEYLELLVEYQYNKKIEKQMGWIKEGFYFILEKNKIELFNEKELDRIICGDDFDLEDLKGNVILEGYNKDSVQIVWLWEIVSEMKVIDKGRFVQFVTGSPRAPIGGFIQLKTNNGQLLPFTIASIHYDNSDLMMPTAHTCANRLEIPLYSSKEILKEKLMKAITECFNYEFD